MRTAATFRSLPLAAAFAFLFAFSAAAQPSSWSSRGPGGGGALYSPSISPFNSSDAYLACDLSAFFHTADFGQTWNVVDFRQMQGNHYALAQYCPGSVIYCLNYEGDTPEPVKSLDGGATWAALGADPTFGDAWAIRADPANNQRVIVADYNNFYFSSDGGANFNLRYSDATGNGCHIAGAFFDGSNIYVGTNGGLRVSANGGTTFPASAAGGIPAGEAIVSFCGAKQGATVRLYAVTLGSADVYNGITGADYFGYQNVYTLDVGAPNWVQRTTGIAAGTYPFFVGSPLGDISVAYLAGGSDAGAPIVYKTTNGGANWGQVLTTAGNGNVITGWSGQGGDRGWGYGEYALGLAVGPNDGNRVIITDLGFPHGTTDGGTTWRQMYVNPADQNPAGSNTPVGKAYHGIGIENTSCWWVEWSSAAAMFAGYTDIKGTRSGDGGATWSFNYTGHPDNSMFHISKHPSTGALYGATSTVHDMYQSTYLTDARIDGGDGALRLSTDQGATWSTLHDFNHPVIFTAINPNNTDQMYASVIHSTTGGIYVTSNLQNGAASTWAKTAANPPRTEGHPFNVYVLNDGSIVCSYSGRRNSGGTFTASSGVFISGNGGASWTDRSDPGMVYWTKDLLIDPNDASQNTWYASVWSGWGGPPNGLGGLYKTTNRGVNWTRINALDRVSSATISPTNAQEMYITTETEGLWRTANLAAPLPTFSLVSSYPYRQPERVFYNPYNSNEIWVTSFGHGVRVGSVVAASPTPSLTPTASQTPSLTASLAPSLTASLTPSPSQTASLTASISPSPTPSLTASATPSQTVSPTASLTPSLPPTASISPSLTPSLSATPTPAPTSTPTFTPSATPTPFDDAQPLAHTVPSEIPPGTILIVGMIFGNTGTLGWDGDPTTGASLAVESDSCSALSPSPLAINPGDQVPPAGQYQFIGTLTAPASPGPCSIQLRMHRNSGGAFGSAMTISFDVASPPNAARDWPLYE